MKPLKLISAISLGLLLAGTWPAAGDDEKQPGAKPPGKLPDLSAPGVPSATHPPATAADLDRLYLGQKKPGAVPELFAPGVISVEGSREHCLALSPKGDELFFTRSREWPHSKIMHMKRHGDQWSRPEPAAFLKDDWATQPVFSPDGQYLYYSSSRGKSDIRYFSLWRSRKTGDGWSEPESVIDMGGGLMMEFHPTVTRDGSVFFLYWDFPKQTGDIYVARMAGGKLAKPVIVGPPISTPFNEVRPTVDPEEHYLLFESDRPGGYGKTDVYVSFKQDDGTWSAPKNLGPDVDDTPSLSPDGRYWFFSKNGDIYWMRSRFALTSDRSEALTDPAKEAGLGR